MKIIGIIPARYNSSRFVGKPLADIYGKPMTWWVYNRVKEVKGIDEIYVATDDKRILDECEKLRMDCILTSSSHKTPTDRIHEVSEKIESDYYISVNGDEPLIDPKTIEKIIPKTKNSGIFVSNIITSIKDPIEVVDYTNLKVVTNEDGIGVYISRAPIPYPKGSMEFNYKKHVGVYAFNKKALDYYVSKKRGPLETVEDIDLLRYIENGEKVLFIDADCNTLSVDTPKDLEKVKNILKNEAIQ